jgi:hypothetical protein
MDHWLLGGFKLINAALNPGIDHFKPQNIVILRYDLYRLL